MKDKDNSVIFLKDWLFLITPMSAENQIVFWELFTNYEYGKEQECDNPIVSPTWNFVKKQLDNMKNTYKEKVVNRNRQNGSKGGRPSKTQKTQSEKPEPNVTKQNPKNPVGLNETQKTPKEKEKDKEKENVNDILLKKESKEENITKENPEELFSIDPEPKKRKKIPPKKEKKYFTRVDFKNRLIELGVSSEDAEKWIEVRKQKRAVFTEDAIQLVIAECEKHNFSFPDAIKACRIYGWQGFEYDWYLNKQKNNNGQTNNNSTNNGYNTHAGSANSKGNANGKGGKVSASSILARQARAQYTGNGESGTFTVETEVVE
ncbi:DUF6291 domain-containing protein [Chryseobacterium sp.]|jgi:hypothetical protein|uniref:DUF6291 domain-containing protein n=1 Tax=Chryseobacterium sp. TaxID=1871047 RepID=UPI0028453E9F|nr:DUF6291 domain-containing protein [Chryseobacterium sp.]MDR3026024.1 DUF6291 domain-containing protein [Chryseobacterium sp.]